MNSDNYEFSKSSEPQSVSNYTPYTEKQFNYINDINSGVYSNNSGLSLVQWDLTSIYNSAGFSDASDLYLALPIIMCAGFGTGAALVAPAATTAGYGLMSLKSNYQHLIHQLEIVCNGKTVEQMQPFVSVAKHFKLISEMSATDLKSINVSLGISETLDNERSVQWKGAAAGAGTAQIGIGLANNKPWDRSVASTDIPLIQNALQNGGTVNGAIQKRISRIVDSSKNGGASFNGIYGTTTAAATPTIMSATQLATELKPYYTVSNGIMTWFDIGLIPLKYLSDFINKLGLVKKLDLMVRAYVNTGSLAIAVTDPDAITTAYGAISNSTFSNTCPFTINYIAGTAANSGIPGTVTNIVAGLFLSKIPTTSVFGVNLAASGLSHPMPACRCYYSQVALDPSRALTYVRENTEKQIVYEQLLFNQYTNITAGGSFSQLIQSGIKNPVSILVIPFISTSCLATVGAVGNLNFSQYGSPYDTSPASYAPISLTNFTVTLGGVNVLNTSLNFTYENFISQVATAESLTSADIGVSCGLITQSWWEQNRVYFVDLARGNAADKEMPRNLTISFNNNTLIPIDIMVFTVYLDKIVINVQTGQVTK